MTTTIIILIISALIVLPFEWRERRNRRRDAMGLCYQCGGGLMSGCRGVKLYFRGGAETFNFCNRCVRHRRIVRWLSVILFAVFALLLWLAPKLERI